MLSPGRCVRVIGTAERVRRHGRVGGGRLQRESLGPARAAPRTGGYAAGVDAPDSPVFARACAGDAVAVGQLIEQYMPQLHAFVRVRLGGALRARESTADVAQSVCRELLARPGQFVFCGEHRFRAWLFTAALNKLRDKHRFHAYAKRDVAREGVAAEERALAEAANCLTPSVDAIGRETALLLDEAMAALTEEHREVLTMARIARLPHGVIAELLGRSEPAVRQLLVRALRSLAKELRLRGVEPA